MLSIVILLFSINGGLDYPALIYLIGISRKNFSTSVNKSHDKINISNAMYLGVYMGQVSDLFRLKIKPNFIKGGHMTINWINPLEKISKHFTVKEACWLPSWSQLYCPTPEEQSNILQTAGVMDQIRDIIDSPINIHCWIRPAAYNQLVGGAPHSMHIYGLAVDWDCGENCDTTRTRLIPLMKTLNIRMENSPGGPWVHIDIKPVRSETERYFKP